MHVQRASLHSLSVCHELFLFRHCLLGKKDGILGDGGRCLGKNKRFERRELKGWIKEVKKVLN